MFDMLIEILEKNSEYKYFTYDGQTAVVEDYLQIRPENREKISKFVKEGRIFIWSVDGYQMHLDKFNQLHKFLKS